MSPNTNHQHGFTLIEVMVTIAVLSIILAIAIPSFQSSMARAQITTQTNAFITAVNSARTEAIKNNTHAALCASNNTTTCTAGNWSNGWIVFVDADRDGVLDAGEVITHTGQAPGNMDILDNFPAPGAGISDPTIRFRSDGTLFGSFGTVRVCKQTTALPANENARDIVISASGRTRVEKPNPAIAAGTCPAP